MKLRKSFVSNSSSSSYVIIAPPDLLDTFMDEFDDITRSIVAAFIDVDGMKNIVLDKKKYEVFQCTAERGEFIEPSLFELGMDDIPMIEEKWLTFFDKLGKQKNVAIIETVYA